MSRETLRDAVRDLGWSLFAELGVPGVLRRHRQVAIDPEPIVVAAPSLFELDPRLRDQVYGWCATNWDSMSISRLQGLARPLTDRSRVAFLSFVATLRSAANIRWPVDGSAAWPRVPEVKAHRVPLERPALLRMRLRALCGVGARADVLAELLARSGTWTRASQLAEEGYSKRAIAGILAELSDAGLARQVAEGNALAYQLARPEVLRALVGGDDVSFPPWRRIMTLVVHLLELVDLAGTSDPVRRVEANKRRDALQRVSDQIGLPTPPETRGNPTAWEDLVSWGTKIAVELAEGTSPALGVYAVRAHDTDEQSLRE